MGLCHYSHSCNTCISMPLVIERKLVCGVLLLEMRTRFTTTTLKGKCLGLIQADNSKSQYSLQKMSSLHIVGSQRKSSALSMPQATRINWSQYVKKNQWTMIMDWPPIKENHYHAWHAKAKCCQSDKTHDFKLASEGAWTKWDLPKRKITWAYETYRGWSHSASPCCWGRCMKHSQPQQTCTSGAWGKTHCASCVGREAPWNTSCLGVKQHSPKKGAGATTTRCSWHSLTP